MTNAFVQMSGVFAELELRMIRARVRSGMANAKAKGKKIGRPQTNADDIPPIFIGITHHTRMANSTFQSLQECVV